MSTIFVVAAFTALVLAAAALLVAYVMARSARYSVLYDHGARLQDVEHAVVQLSTRQTKRTASENMEVARSAFKQRRAASDAVLAEAQSVIAAVKEQPQQELPMGDPKDALRKRLGIVS